jgi:mRNA interferase RelE/StbE
LAWRIELTDTAAKQLSKMGRTEAKRITAFLRERLATMDDPRQVGHALKGAALGGLWRYRVGDHRIVASIEDDRFRVLVVRIGNRREVHRV